MPRLVALASVLALTVAPAVPAGADALTERYTRSDGLAGLGAFEGTSVTVTSATAQRDSSTVRFSGSFMSAIQKMVGAGDSVRITRLDRDLVWTLDPEKKTYSEAPLTARGERARPGPGAPPARPERTEPSDVVVTRNEFKVDRTGARKTISGFDCEEYLATWLLETRNQKTGDTGRSTMTMRFWTTPETAEIRAAQAEEAAYQKAYLERLKLEATPADLRNFGLATLAGSLGLDEAEQQKLGRQLRAEMAKIKGFAVVTDTRWQVEGPAGQPGGARAGGGAPSGTGDLGSALNKLFGGGAAKSDDPARPAGEKAPLFSLYSEVRSIKVVPAEAQRYEVPAGYARK